MNNRFFTYVLIFVVLVTVFAGFVATEHQKYTDGKLHVLFCDVGQGDAILIRTPKGGDILIDGGESKKVLDCLASSMPFWDRTIELILLTHPHQDHFLGLFDVFDRYEVSSFATERLTNNTESFAQFQKKVQAKDTPWQTIYKGDRFNLADGVSINVHGPSKEYLFQTSPKGAIGEGREFASLILQISYGSFDLLITGDSQYTGLIDALVDKKQPSIEVFQVPHHGSKTGITPEVIERIQPKIAIISVGKNRYGHPSQSILEILKDKHIPIFRTDRDGTIEILSDGKQWSIKTQRRGG